MKKSIRKVNCYIFRDKSEPGAANIIFENGAVACADNDNDYIKIGFYEEHIKPKTSISTLWEKLGDGGDLVEFDLDGSDPDPNYKRKEIVDDEVIKLMLNYYKENDFEYVIHEMNQDLNKMKSKDFNAFKSKLKFRDDL